MQLPLINFQSTIVCLHRQQIWPIVCPVRELEPAGSRLTGCMVCARDVREQEQHQEQETACKRGAHGPRGAESRPNVQLALNPSLHSANRAEPSALTPPLAKHRCPFPRDTRDSRLQSSCERQPSYVATVRCPLVFRYQRQSETSSSHRHIRWSSWFCFVCFLQLNISNNWRRKEGRID